MPSDTMASVVYLQVLNSGRAAPLLCVAGFSGRISVYLLRGQSGAAFLLLAVGRTDLHELGFRRNGFGNMRIDLRVVAGRVGASVLLADVRKQELVMPCPFGAIHAASRCWHKLRVPLVEGSMFEDEEDVALNPELEIADGEKDAFRLLPCRPPILFEASGERLFLLVGLELRQQERMADADLLGVERFDDRREQVRSA